MRNWLYQLRLSELHNYIIGKMDQKRHWTEVLLELLAFKAVKLRDIGISNQQLPEAIDYHVLKHVVLGQPGRYESSK